MNNNRKLFQETFSELHASENRVMEVVNMKGTNKIRKFPAKKVIAVAACVCSLAAVGVVANAATDGALTKTIVGWFTNANGEKTAIEGEVSYDENGNKTVVAEGDGYSITQKENTDGTGSISIGVDGDALEGSVELEDGTVLDSKEFKNIEVADLDGIDMEKYFDKEKGEVCVEDGIYTEVNDNGDTVTITVKNGVFNYEIVTEDGTTVGQIDSYFATFDE